MAFRRKQKPSPSSKTYEITFINLSIHEITVLSTRVKNFIYSIFGNLSWTSVFLPVGCSTGCLADLFFFPSMCILTYIQQRSSEIIGLFRGNTDDYFHALYLPHQTDTIRTSQNSRKVLRAQVHPLSFFQTARQLIDQLGNGPWVFWDPLVSQSILFPQKRFKEVLCVIPLTPQVPLFLEENSMYMESAVCLSTTLSFIHHVILSKSLHFSSSIMPTALPTSRTLCIDSGVHHDFIIV